MFYQEMKGLPFQRSFGYKKKTRIKKSKYNAIVLQFMCMMDYICYKKAESPVVFAKACEMFIQEPTLQSWQHTEENKDSAKERFAAAISRTDVFDFLVDIIPRDEPKEEGLGVTKATIPMASSTADSGPYYYVPSQQQPPKGPPAPGMIIRTPVDQHQHQADQQ